MKPIIIYLALLQIVFFGCTRVMRNNDDGAEFLPYLTDKDLNSFNTSEVVSNDSIQEFFETIKLNIPVLRIDTSLLHLTRFYQPTVMVYKDGRILDEHICNAHFPGFIEFVHKASMKEDKWVSATLSLEELRSNIIGIESESIKPIQVFYFYTIYYENFLIDKIIPLYNESKHYQDQIELYIVSTDNHPGMGLSAKEYSSLLIRKSPPLPK